MNRIDKLAQLNRKHLDLYDQYYELVDALKAQGLTDAELAAHEGLTELGQAKDKARAEYKAFARQK